MKTRKIKKFSSGQSTGKKHALIVGTIVLTATGLITRFLGFFYRIFLSQKIGAEALGIYQLIAPVSAIAFSIGAAGIQTSISRSVAAKSAAKDEKSARDILIIGLVLSTVVSSIIAYLVYDQAAFISDYILMESRCEGLLKILALSIPLCSVHCCINGYYYGMKESAIPAINQFLEQLVRVVAIFVVSSIFEEKGIPVTANIAVVGLVIGEAASMLVSITAIIFRFGRPIPVNPRKVARATHLRNILVVSVPLSANRVLLNILQSAESIMIPSSLQQYGLTSSEALSIYGVLTGMALPLILFPSALTNSVSVLLLPTIAEAQAIDNDALISRTIQATIKYCLMLGILFTGVFLIFGDEMGTILFQDNIVGKFIITLAWICPFLYLSTTLTSILNGLGHTTKTFINNMVCLVIRLLFVIIGIPVFGITAYLWGILASELVITGLCLMNLRKDAAFQFQLYEWIIKPTACLLISVVAAQFIYNRIENISFAYAFIPLLGGIGLLCLIYLIGCIVSGLLPLAANKDFFKH